jgi:hypothetical protein
MGWMAKNRLSKNSAMLPGIKLARNGDKKGLEHRRWENKNNYGNLKCYEKSLTEQLRLKKRK